ncbi:MAG: tetratricopeptide repeat protein [Candidatus Aminicenantes bacterium]|jgi:tetratricopeptide (TPR) repeat protein
MKGSAKAFVWMGVSIFVMCFFFPFGCQKQSKEIPITSYSDEAEKLFIEARDKYEFLHREKADALLREALEKDPLFAQAHIYRILTCAATDEIEKAVEKAAKNADRATEGEQLLIKAFKAQYWEKDYAKAIEIYQKLKDLYPEDARMCWLFARAYRDSGDSEKAIEQNKKAIAINEDFAPAHKDLGYRYSAKRDYEEAEKYFYSYLQLNPMEPNSHDSIADLYTKMGRFEDAIAHYKKALEIDPTFTYSHRKLGINLCFIGKFKEGREVLQEAIDNDINPSSKVYTMERFIHSYLYEQDYLSALDAIDQTIEMATANGILQEVARLKLAKCAVYSELKDYENAKKCITDCQKVTLAKNLAPYYKDYYSSERLFWEAWVAAERHEYDEALDKAAEYRAAIEEMNDSMRLKYHIALLGHIAMTRGETRSAFELFKNASIDDPLFHYLTARAKDKSGDKETAAKYFRKAANWNSDTLHYALIRQKALARKVMLSSTEAQ